MLSYSDSKLKSIEHVFFDLDRTLWDFETNSEATLNELYSEFELREKLGVLAVEFIREYKRINEIFWNDYRIGKIQKAELRYARFEATLKYFGLADRRIASDFGELYISRSPRKKGLVSGAIEVLEYLKPKYQLHIITNGFDEVQHIKMESSGLDPYFQHVITSEEAEAKKPSPVIYDYAARKTGASASNSIMIGDHFEADIVGAIDSGWKAVFFEPDKPRMNEPDFVHILELQELRGLL